MSKKRFTDDRKQLLIRYKIDEKGCVSFIDPCCDEIPICLFGKIMEAISNVEQEWNCRIANKVDPLPRYYLNDHNLPKSLDKIGLKKEDIEQFRRNNLVFP